MAKKKSKYTVKYFDVKFLKENEKFLTELEI